jgi:hypothetical protein
MPELDSVGLAISYHGTMRNVVASPLETSFIADLENIALNLIKAFGLRYKQEHANLSWPLMRWMDFRHRYVEPIPRPTVFSDKFHSMRLPPDAAQALRQLVSMFEAGVNVNPYQGRGLIINNDTSALSGHKRTDLLFADWGILHFHLTTKPIPADQYFSAPADYLAFCLVGSDGVAFIDVLRHPRREGFASMDLFETMARNWPEYIEQYRLRGILPGRQALTTEEVSTLREGGVAAIYNYQGAAFMGPGGGLTSACTPVRLTVACDHITEGIRTLARFVDDPAGQVRKHPVLATVPSPQFQLGLFQSGLLVREVHSNTGFNLLQDDSSDGPTWVRRLSEEISPAWAINALKL